MSSSNTSIRRVAVTQHHQLVAKLNINNQEHWLYRVQALHSAGHATDYYLLDASGIEIKSWHNADLADVKTEIKTMTTHQVNEDHFASEQIEKIKSCQDSAVRDFYKQYLQAEALGDTAAADRLAANIRKRCNLLGVFSEKPASKTEPVAESAENFKVWENRMIQAGVTEFKTDVHETTSPSTVQGYKLVGGKHVMLGEYDLVLDQEIFETTPLMTKYTAEGKDVDMQLWTESILAEGATAIKDFSGGRVAYLGEARLGIFRVREEKPVKKSFNTILKESFTVNMTHTANEGGDVDNTVTVTATGGDASQLLSILRLSGLGSQSAAGDLEVEVTEEYANSPDEKYADTDTQLNKMAGGLNKPKRMSNPNNPGDNPLAMKKLGVNGGQQINIEEAKLAEALITEFGRYGSEPAQELSELSPQLYKNYIDSAVGDYAHTNAVAQRTPADQQKPLRDRLNNRNKGMARAQTGLDRYADSVMQENVEAEGDIGDEVVVSGPVQFKGARGVIADFGQDRRFVVVDLYDHGKRSFHASDVSVSDSDDYDDDDDDYDYEPRDRE